MNIIATNITRMVLVMLISIPVVAQAALPDFTVIVDKAKDSVVNISTKTKPKRSSSQEYNLPELPEGSPFGELFEKFFDRDELDRRGREAQSLGSGFIISEDGYILTNHHVISGADEVIVRMSNRKEFIATVIGSDQASDVAVLKVEAEDLPVLRFGDSEKLKVGAWVLAIGSPFGFDHSVTAGIVSAKGRSLPSDNYVPFIQTDVAINPGNSGGPLFNLDGEVIGINSQIYSRTGGFMGLSFAIPIEMAVDVANQIKETGTVSRGWLGVLIQDVTLDLAESFGMKQPRGALIAKVLPDSPAQAAGMQVGDVIVGFDGREVMNSANLPPIVGSSKVGVKIPVDIIRGGRKQHINVTLGELPDDDKIASVNTPEAEKTNRLGITVVDLTAEQQAELELDGGVLVRQVVAGAASRAGIRQDDIILRVDNKDVSDISQFNKLIAGLPAGKSVAFLVQRDGSPTFLAVKVPETD